MSVEAAGSAGGSRPLVRVSVSRRFAFPLREGCQYITDLGRWREYWPDLIRLAPESRWSEPGDTARLTLKLLGRPTELEMTLSRVVPSGLRGPFDRLVVPRAVERVARQTVGDLERRFAELSARADPPGPDTR